jgi:GrpB-like predicted nucleotidyltransferase (UPF0157 family)
MLKKQDKEYFMSEQDPIVQPSVQPLTEAELTAVTIGPPEVLNNTIHLADYDPAWPLIFTRLALEIHRVLGNKVLDLEHVGSTSVPNLAAKPIIDMVLVVRDSSQEPIYVPPLETLGYGLKIREPNWYQHRLLKRQDIPSHLHVFSIGCEEIGRMIRFRNHLRSHPEARKSYEATKRQLAQQIWKYTQNYADAKSGTIAEIMNQALGDSPKS